MFFMLWCVERTLRMIKEREGRDILARRIRELRQARGWAQDRLAEESCLHRTYIGAIERSEHNVGIDTIAKLASALKISLKDLFDGSKSK